MQNYLHLPINNYNNLDYIQNINLKLELIKETISNNKTIKFEYSCNDQNEMLNIKKNKKRKKDFINNLSFYIKIDDNIITDNNNNLLELVCNICYEINSPSNFKILNCNHKLCNLCFKKWSNNCCNNILSCPYCRKNIY
jgi:dTDP-glucose pyrophosphorylase